jgi:Putative 2OG-Fe(II) oxygenase
MREYSERLGVRDKIELLKQGLDASPGKAALLYELSAALAATGENHRSSQAFRAAFRFDSSLALTSLVGPPAGIAANQAMSIRDRARALLEYGVAVSPVLAALAIAEGLLGNESGVRWLIDYERLFAIKNALVDNSCSLAEEIRSDLKFYDRPARRSIRRGWRRNQLNRSELPAITALCGTLRDHVDRYIQSLPRHETHPFRASAPLDYVLEAWAVVSDGATYHESHIHNSAWLSGVYYVVQPPASLDRSMNRGWLHVGPPRWLGPLSGWDEKLVEPAPGTLILMPAYFFHHTMPMGVDEERICVAFDVVPAALAAPEYRAGTQLT